MYSADEIRSQLAGALDPAGEYPETGERAAAVLVPVITDGETRVVFTRRTDTLSRHAGEISFPGGLVDPGEPPMAAALRETEEELGLRPVDIEVLGVLPPVHTRVTGIVIVPYVGWLTVDPRYTPNAAEIADVLEFSLEDLVARGGEREFEWEGSRFQTYAYDMDGALIWGATARVLYTMLELIQGRPPGAWEVRRLR